VTKIKNAKKRFLHLCLRRLRPVDAHARSTHRVTLLRRAIRQIRHSVPSATLQMLVLALVHSRLDYGNGVLVGLPAYLTRRLQSVLNAAAQAVARGPATTSLMLSSVCTGCGFRDEVSRSWLF